MPCFPHRPARLIVAVLMIVSVFIASPAVAETVRAVVPRYFPPQHILDARQQPAGFAIDYMNLIADRAGLDIQYITAANWAEVNRAMAEGKADLIPNMGISPARRKIYDFTQTIETFEIVIFIRVTTNDIGGVADLKDRRVAVVRTNLGERVMKSRPGARLVFFQDMAEAFFALIAGHVDALVYPKPPIANLAFEAGLREKIKIAGRPLKEIKRGVAVAKGNSALLARLDRAVTELNAEGAFRPLYTKWYGEAIPFWNLKRVLWVTGGTAVFIFVLMLGWRWWSTARLNTKLEASRREMETARDSLAASREELALITDSLPVLIGYIDSDMIYRYANSYHQQWHGRPTGEIIGRSLKEILNPEMYQAIEPRVKQALAGQTVFFQDETVGPLGKPRSYEARYVPRRDTNERVIGLFILIQDITRRLQAEKALRQSEANYRSLAENIQDSITRYDGQYRHIYINRPDSHAHFGDHQSPLGKTDREMGYDPDLCHLWEVAIGQVFESGTSHNEVFRVGEGAQQRVFDWRLFPESDDSGRVISVLGVTREVTAIVRAEEDKRNLEHQLRQTQKMDAIGRLAGGVAHDFNNLLSAMLGYAELARDDIGSPEDLAADLDQILQAGWRARDLTGQLLAFSRKQILDLKPLNLNDAVRNVEQMIRRLIGEDIRVGIAADDDLWVAMADFHQVEQILINLAINARDAMPDGGRLTIETANLKVVEGDSINETGTPPGGHVMLRVTDSGHGMDEDTINQAFEPFFTTKEKGKGTGLGLATVHGIVTQHGGRVDIFSRPDQGASVRILLPRVSEQAVDYAALEENTDTRGGSETILVVEDDDMVRGYVVQTLKRLGYEVLEAADGWRAADVFRNADRDVDLVLTDVVMPGRSGREMYEELAGMKNDIRVVFMSGYNDDVIAHHGVLEAGVNLLPKPFSRDKLAAKIRGVLDG